jgi:polysaccharide export outer membrane protein
MLELRPLRSVDLCCTGHMKKIIRHWILLVGKLIELISRIFKLKSYGARVMASATTTNCKDSMNINPTICSSARLALVLSLLLGAGGVSARISGQDSNGGQSGASRESSVAQGLPTISSPGDSRARYQPLPRGNQQSAPLPRSDFDAFSVYAQTVTGSPVERFGRNLFSDVSSTFTPLDAAQVNGDYIIGTGDEIQIRGWGMINVDVTATVDREGAIYIPRVGAVRVAGVKYRDLQGNLKQAISKNFNNFELTASISQTRAVQIYVVGHAARPGTYTLNAMSTLLNALFVAGGPDSTGTMRNIQLKRGGAVVTTFDLYDMLVRGDKSNDATLRDGDVIYIPEVGPLAALTGNVKKPAIFELKGPATVADLVQWAGGVASAADQRRIVVEKSVDNNYMAVADIIADSNSPAVLSNIAVNPADVIRVFSPGAVPVQAHLQNEYVRVSGEVKRSGVFQLRKGETLRELMFRLGGATDTGYIFATQVRRESVRVFQQQKLDEAAERFEREVENAATTRSAGSVDKDSLATIAAEVERQRQTARKLRSVKSDGRIVLELENASAELKNLPDLALQDGDSIIVPRKPGTIDVIGSVFQSNSFIYKSRRTVKDYLQLAGGATSTADESEMYVIRADGTARSGHGAGWFSGVGGTEVNPGDTIVVPEKIERSSWRQSLKEWTSIFYQFGLGAAGLKVLKN